MIKKFLCWLTGHKWAPLTPAELQSQIPAVRAGLPVKMAKCDRCGVWK